MRNIRRQNLGGARTAFVGNTMLNDMGESRYAASHDSVEDDTATARVSGVMVVEYFLSVAAVALAAVYGVVFLWTFFLSDYFYPSADAPLWAMRDSPQTGIFLCLIFAAAFLRLWRGRIGKVLSFATYLFIGWQFYNWFDLTRQVRSNAGAEAMGGAGWIGNKLYGAGALDVLTFLTVLVFICLSTYLLAQNITAAVNVRRKRNAPRQFMDRVTGMARDITKPEHASRPLDPYR
jgi:hypothetical protein